jgi:FlaA1/EpsC-like NDP-sugar epimerase
MPLIPSSKPRDAFDAKKPIDCAGSETNGRIHDTSIEDLLGTHPVRIDEASIRERIKAKVVMVTGAAGSIGAELCRQIARFHPRAIVGFDQAETPLFHIERELAKSFPALQFHAEIGNIARRDDLDRTMLKYRPSVLFHAAAYKHVHLMEKHVFAAVENNVFGTWQVALAAASHGVEDFVLISTDKAVRPASMMGATKRMAELVIRSMQKERGTRFIAVRFGNVVGSNGSVVPIFQEQIAAGGPVTVTHPDMHRYFITIPDAAQLVLQASSIGKGGEIFTLDMGEPVRIVDLARNLILLSGLEPDRDIKIEFTGIRPGEKLHEELNLNGEHLLPTCHERINSGVPVYSVDSQQIKSCLRSLEEMVSDRNVTGLVSLLKEMISDYTPDSALLKAEGAVDAGSGNSLFNGGSS